MDLIRGATLCKNDLLFKQTLLFCKFVESAPRFIANGTLQRSQLLVERKAIRCIGCGDRLLNVDHEQLSLALLCGRLCLLN